MIPDVDAEKEFLEILLSIIPAHQLGASIMVIDIEFWTMKLVAKKVGLSQTEMHRRIAEGRFPQSLHYGDGGKRKFWLSTEIIDWQQAVLAKNQRS